MATDKKMTTPDITAKKGSNFSPPQFGNELPEIPNQGNYQIISKTPNQHASKSMKRSSNNGLNNNTGPPK